MATDIEVDAYARISADREGDQVGVDDQIRELRAWAKRQGWTVRDVYLDPDVSATSGKRRDGFEALLERPVRRPVVVWHTDRLARLPRDMERVLDQELTVHGLHAGHLDLTTPGGRMVARMLTAAATAELELKRERAVKSNVSRAAKGYPYWKRAPFGHTVDGAVVEPQAALIRQAVQDVATGASLGSVTRAWNAAGAATSQGAARWTAGRVRDVLLNPRLAGILEFKGERQPLSKIEPLVSEADWSAVVGILTAPGRGAGGGPTANLLTGIAWCGRCMDGTTVNGTTKSTRKGNVLTYRCSSAGHCQHHRELADEWVVLKTLEFLTGPDAHEVLAEDNVQEAAEEAARLRDELQGWEAAAASLGPSEYVRITGPLKLALEAAETALRAGNRATLFAGLVEPGPTTIETLQGLGRAFTVWDGLPLERQRAIVAATWSRVVLLPRPSTARGFEPEYIKLER